MFNIKENIFLQIRRVSLLAFLACAILLYACNDGNSDDTPVPNDDDMPMDGGGEPAENEFVLLLTNQIDNVIIAAANNYEMQLLAFQNAVNTFSSETTEQNFNAVRSAFDDAYQAYQRMAVHNYFVNANRDLVERSNLFPSDEAILDQLIASQSFEFTSADQRMATGFPALELMLFGQEEGLGYFTADQNRVNFFVALVDFLTSEASTLQDSWTGDLRENFINNGGTALGSSISVQLNESVIYWEDRIREDKVGIPIGRLGPLDTPIPADPTLIEAFNRSQFDGNETFTLSLVRTAVTEMQMLFTGGNGQGYDDLLINRDQNDLVNDINNQFDAIFAELDSRDSISGDEELFDAVQGIVTLFKGDLFPLLNVQDADAANDGD